MQRYVIQLISDVEVAITNAPPVSEYAGFSVFGFEQDSDGLNLSFAPQRLRLCDLFGLHAQAFPPENRLNRSQITALLRSIERLWSAYQISWDMPYGLSARRRYTAMAEKMRNYSIDYTMGQGTEVDFCNDRKKCPFGDGGVCTCREVERSVERDMLLWEKMNQGDSDVDITDFENPMDDVRKWLNDGKDLPPWFLDEKNERWNLFQDTNEQLEWLYFFRPDGGENRTLYPYDLDDEPDFEDFDWDEMKDKDSYSDDDLDLPF